MHRVLLQCYYNFKTPAAPQSLVEVPLAWPGSSSTGVPRASWQPGRCMTWECISSSPIHEKVSYRALKLVGTAPCSAGETTRPWIRCIPKDLSLHDSYRWGLWRIKGCKVLPWPTPIIATSRHSHGSSEHLTQASHLGGVLPVHECKIKLVESNRLHTYLIQTHLNELSYTSISHS